MRRQCQGGNAAERARCCRAQRHVEAAAGPGGQIEAARGGEAGAADAADSAGQGVGQRAGRGVGHRQDLCRAVAHVDDAEVQRGGGELCHRRREHFPAQVDGVAKKGGVGEAVDAARGGQRQSGRRSVEIAGCGGVEVDARGRGGPGDDGAAGAAHRGEAGRIGQVVEQALLIRIGRRAVGDRHRLRRHGAADAGGAENEGRGRHDGRGIAIQRAGDGDRLRPQERAGQAVDAGPIRPQQDRGRTTLHPVLSAAQADRQA